MTTSAFASAAETARAQAAANTKLTETSGNKPTSFYRPVSQKILDSCGDLGVPRVQKKSPTKAKEFSLSSARKRTAEDAPQEEKPLYSSFGVATKANVKRQQVASSAPAPPKPTTTTVKAFNLQSSARPKKPAAATCDQPLYSSFGSSKTPAVASSRKLPKTAAPAAKKAATKTPNAPAKPTSEEKLLKAAEVMSMLKDEAEKIGAAENEPAPPPSEEVMEDAPGAAAESTAVDISDDTEMDEFVSAREEISEDQDAPAEEEQATPPQEPPTILHSSMSGYAVHTGMTPSRA